MMSLSWNTEHHPSNAEKNKTKPKSAKLMKILLNFQPKPLYTGNSIT
jgi:hypothetical protein